ncbi:TVP38/TMEM64 family protein [Streptomyces sp. PT12]|uniref:TVP38/TMEM64 family protein n=1 Tax=Streptomyces sp. PT12 TaxID=1510197 RepID=UPI00215C1F0A|nr:VTT domain-containing protein [Streptomyces sp. PT12]
MNTSPWARLALLALLLAATAGAVLALGRPTGAAPYFIALYALCTLVFVPKPALTAAAGALFGAGHGLAVAVTGTLLGALLAFAAGRLLGRDALRPLLRRFRPLASLDRRLTGRPFTSVLTLRVLPVMPFTAVNLTAAFSGTPWLPYATATLVGTLPANVAYTLAGATATNPASPALWAPAAALLLLLGTAAAIRRRRAQAAMAAPRP